MLPAAPDRIDRRGFLLGKFLLGVVLLRGRELQQAPRIAHDRSRVSFIVKTAVDDTGIDCRNVDSSGNMN